MIDDLNKDQCICEECGARFNYKDEQSWIGLTISDTNANNEHKYSTRLEIYTICPHCQKKVDVSLNKIGVNND